MDTASAPVFPVADFAATTLLFRDDAYRREAEARVLGAFDDMLDSPKHQ